MKELFPTFSKLFSSSSEQGEQSEATHDEKHQCCYVVRSSQLPTGRAMTVNLSRDGLCLETFFRIPRGIDLEMELDLGAFPIATKGKVTRCKEFSKGIYHIGVDIRESRPNALNAIARFLAQVS